MGYPAKNLQDKDEFFKEPIMIYHQYSIYKFSRKDSKYVYVKFTCISGDQICLKKDAKYESKVFGYPVYKKIDRQFVREKVRQHQEII